MDIIQQSSSHIEFSRPLPVATRAIILIGGLLPLFVLYELLIRPSWRGEFSVVWFFSLLISAGALAVSLFFLFAAWFGMSQRIRFDAQDRVVTHCSKTALSRWRKKCYPFSDIEMLHVQINKWTDGPDIFTLRLKIKRTRDIEFGSFEGQAEADRYLSVLKNMIGIELK